MTTDSTNAQRGRADRRGRRAPAPAAARGAADTQELLCRVLLLANQPLARAEFVAEVGTLLATLCGADAVQLTTHEGGRVQRCEVVLGEAPRYTVETDTSGCAAGAPADALRGFAARTSLPLVVGDRHVSTATLLRRGDRPFNRAETARLAAVSPTLALAMAHQRANWAQRERVKELTCLYGIAQAMDRSALSLDGMLERIAGLLPPGWQYPEVCGARIVLDGRSHSTPEFRESRVSQRAEIRTRGVRRGYVEVCYSEPRPAADEGPFLAEERNLINEVARQVALLVERGETEEEHKTLENGLRQADRLATIGQLAAGTAHELNEPLASILGYSELAKKAGGTPPQVVADLEKICRAALQAREVVKKLMLFARQSPPQMVPSDLGHLVEEGLEFLQHRCAEAGVDLDTRLATGLPPVMADPSQLLQVLVNLVVNAVQAMPGGGRLTVATQASSGRVTLVVEDTGCGMTDEVKRQIFLPFFTTKPVGQGTGLGLAVVHGIVEAHGGTIRVDSAVGKGTRFEVDLPLGERGAPPATDAPPRGSSS